MNRVTDSSVIEQSKRSALKPYVWLAVSLLLLMYGCRTAATSTSLPSRTIPPTNSQTSTIPPSTQGVKLSQAPTSPFTQTSAPPPIEPTETITPQPSATTIPPVVFAAIGDYGSGSQNEADVANLILSWNPDFIITLGDNNYPSGAADHMDDAVGQFFHSFIYPYMGSVGEGGEVNRFFPSLGNHDLISENGKPYFDYFSLPGNERYYDFTWGPVHLFALDDIDSEPDGVGASSIQAEWLKQGLANSTSSWNIVYMHYPPYSSGTHGSTDWARWPYAEWGADAVLAGHDHTYERLEEGGLPYFVNGIGGSSIYSFKYVLDGSLVRFNADYGAMRIEATDTYILFEFITRAGEVVDSYEIRK